MEKVGLKLGPLEFKLEDRTGFVKKILRGMNLDEFSIKFNTASPNKMQIKGKTKNRLNRFIDNLFD